MNEEISIENIIKTNLDNISIFEYIQTLEQENIDLKQQLKQKDEVIEKAINKLGTYADGMHDNGNAYAICLDILDTLKRYKGDNNE